MFVLVASFHPPTHHPPALDTHCVLQRAARAASNKMVVDALKASPRTSLVALTLTGILALVAVVSLRSTSPPYAQRDATSPYSSGYLDVDAEPHDHASRLAYVCAHSLEHDQKLLTWWFTGQLAVADWPSVLGNLSFSPKLTYVDAKGAVRDFNGLAKLLKEAYGTEPAGSWHQADMHKIKVHESTTKKLNMTFDENQFRNLPNSKDMEHCVVRTITTCEPDRSSPMGICFTSFKEIYSDCVDTSIKLPRWWTNTLEDKEHTS